MFLILGTNPKLPLPCELNFVAKLADISVSTFFLVSDAAFAMLSVIFIKEAGPSNL